MDEVRNKMYNYEATPPQGVWESIASQLDRDGAKVIPLTKKGHKRYYYMAAASIAVILLAVIFFNNQSSKSNDQFTFTNQTADTASGNTALLTVPQQEEMVTKNSDTLTSIPDNKLRKGGPNQNRQITQPDKRNDNSLIASNSDRYITIEGPEGQPVKVSSKMATLIDSSETKTSSKPIWNKKVNEWREIMKGNTLAPTPSNFLDIVELTKSLKDNKKP